MGKIFSKVSEANITEAIVKDFSSRFLNTIKSDCVVIGAGPSGLVASRELAKDGFKVLLIEANNYLGGGFWIGGYLMNGITVREPAQKLLEEIDVPYEKASDGLYIARGPHACSKLIASTCDAGVNIVNMTKFDDVVLRENNRVAGVVINWTPVSALPRAITCVDPVALESKLVIDATGHDAVVANSLAKRNLISIKDFSGMWVEESEDLVVENTKEIHPGLIVAGMAVSTVFGLPRMGPTFGGMLLSGKKAASEAKKILTQKKAKEESLVAA
ncbi:MAG: sulfide-dependent adenosine diphosphate thiazole synthase [bacterium]